MTSVITVYSNRLNIELEDISKGSLYQFEVCEVTTDFKRVCVGNDEESFEFGIRPHKCIMASLISKRVQGETPLTFNLEMICLSLRGIAVKRGDIKNKPSLLIICNGAKIKKRLDTLFSKYIAKPAIKDIEDVEYALFEDETTPVGDKDNKELREHYIGMHAGFFDIKVINIDLKRFSDVKQELTQYVSNVNRVTKFEESIKACTTQEQLSDVVKNHNINLSNEIDKGNINVAFYLGFAFKNPEVFNFLSNQSGSLTIHEQTIQ